MTFSGGTQPKDTVQNPDNPSPSPVRDAQERDDSTHATAGVQTPEGVKFEATGDGDQYGLQATIPWGGSGSGGTSSGNHPAPGSSDPIDLQVHTKKSCYYEGEEFPEGYCHVVAGDCVNGQWVNAASTATSDAMGDDSYSYAGPDSNEGSYDDQGGDAVSSVAYADDSQQADWPEQGDGYIPDSDEMQSSVT